MSATGNLSIEAKSRYAFIEELLFTHCPPPAAVVELGAAPGDQIARLADLGYKATSVDIGIHSDAWADGEEGRMERLLDAHGVEPIVWNLEETPYPLEDDSFDAVIMTEVFEHLRDFPVRSLQEAKRVLKPGGKLYFTTPNTAYIMNRIRVVAGRSTMSSLEDWIGGLPSSRHAREYTFDEIRQLMDYVGFTIQFISSRHFYIHSGRTTPLGRLSKYAISELAKRRPTLGPSIIVVGEKSE